MVQRGLTRARWRAVLWIGLALFVAALIGLALHRTWPLLFPAVAESAPLDADCDLRAGPCAASFPGGGTLHFSIEPRTIPLVEQLRLDVAVRGPAVQSVEVDFSGVDMNMGFNRVQLSPRQGAEAVHASGAAVLPVCVRNRMAWEAKVMVRTERGLLVAPFRFETYRTGER